MIAALVLGGPAFAQAAPTQAGQATTNDCDAALRELGLRRPIPSLKPSYPPAAARHDATGTTRLGFRIDAQGQLIDGEILRSAGTTPFHKLLDSTALLSLMQCGFKPATLDGEPIEGGAWMEYVWRLE